MQERKSLIVYFKNPKVLKRIKRHGNICYYHKKRKYAIIYVNADQIELIRKELEALRHVRKVECSLLDDSAYKLSAVEEETPPEKDPEYVK